MNNYIYGANSCRAAIESGHSIRALYIEKNNWRFIELAREKKIPYTLVEKEKLDRLGGLHQGVAMEIAPIKAHDIADILRDRSAPDFREAFVIIADGIEDPHNFGAILRVADAVGADGVIYRKTRGVGPNATVVRVSTGAAFFVKCVEVVNLTAAIKRLKEAGFWVVGAESAPESVDYWEAEYDMATALVIGSEGKGLSRLVRENCDFLVRIPMRGRINSLNAAVAAGILAYHIKNAQK